MNDVNAAADRSQEARALRDVISSQLTELLAEVERVRPVQDAPAGVDRFVAATERALAVLQEQAVDPREPSERSTGATDGPDFPPRAPAAG